MSTAREPKPEPAPVNPIVAKAADGIRKRRTRTPAPIPFAPTPGQLELFDPAHLEDQP